MKTSWYGFKVMVDGKEIAAVDASEYDSVAAAQQKAHEIGQSWTAVPGKGSGPYALVPVGTALKSPPGPSAEGSL